MKDELTALNEIIKCFPDCIIPFFTETGTELSKKTRLDYAREINYFIDYLISYSPDFCELEKRKIQMDDIMKITSQDVSRYLTLYMDKGHSERSTAKKRASLSRFFSYLVKNRQIPYSPVDAAVHVKIHKDDSLIYLTPDEQNKLLDSVRFGDGLAGGQNTYHKFTMLRDTAVVLMLLDTGIRVSELCSLRIMDVNLERSSAHVLRKGGDMQDVFYSDEAREAIKDYLDTRRLREHKLSKFSPLFLSRKGGTMTPRGVEYMVKKYAMAALPGKGYEITPHKLRSSFAMTYYEATKDILSLQRKLNHKSIQTTTIYAEATEKKMEETRDIASLVRQNAEKNKGGNA